VRLAELSRVTGVSVPSIKYYQREGLLAPGTPLSARKADYGDDHVRRIHLIRAMLTTGGMSVGQVRDVLAVAEDPTFGRHERIGIAQYMLPNAEPPAPEDPENSEWQTLRAEIAAQLRGFGWRFDDHSPALDTMTRSLLTLRALGLEIERPGLFRRYAAAFQSLAEEEYDIVAGYPVLEDAIEAMIGYTVLLEPALAALRRLAHEDVSIRRNYGETGPDASAADESAGDSPTG
jgi:DNA-binding transcriptional MerR regulator